MTGERRGAESRDRAGPIRALRHAAAAAAVRVEGVLARRPLVWALAGTSVFTLLVFLCLTPGFGNRDDVGMMFIADGTFYGEPMPHLIYQNPMVGLALSTLYDWTASVNWYVAWLYSLYALSLGVLLYLVLADRRTHLLLRLTGLTGFVVAFSLWQWTHLQFTSVGITLGGVGLLLYAAMAARERPPVTALVLAGSMVGIASLVRWRSFWAVALLAIPIVLVTLRRIRWQRQMLFAGTAAGIVVAGMLFGSVYYSGDEDWHEFFEFNSVRGRIHSSTRLEDPASSPGLLDAAGWSEADGQMFNSWFYLEEDVYTVEALEAIVAEAGYDLSRVTEVLRVADGNADRVRLVVVAGLFAAAWVTARGRERRFLVGYAVFVGAVLAGLAVYLHLPDRVSVPILGLLGMLCLLRPEAVFRGAYPTPGDGAGALRPPRAAVAVLTAASLLAVSYGIYDAVAESASAERRNDIFFERMDGLAAYDPDAIYVSWAAALGTHAVSAETKRRVPVTLVHLGWRQRSPMHADRLEGLGIDDLYVAIATDPRVVLPIRSNHDYIGYYLDFVAEHYGYTQRFLRPVSRAGSDPGLVLYDLLVDYRLDGRTLIEERADGSTVAYATDGVEIRGVLEVHPNREHALRGWAVHPGSPASPVDRIVVVHGSETLDVATTPIERRGVANRFDMDRSMVGFVIDGLSREELEEIRVFAIAGDTAAELPRK
jgi:hypothetical protein